MRGPRWTVRHVLAGYPAYDIRIASFPLPSLVLFIASSLAKKITYLAGTTFPNLIPEKIVIIPLVR